MNKKRRFLNNLLPALAKSMLTASLFAAGFSGYGQLVVSGGATLHVMPTASFVSFEDLNLLSGGTLDNQGTMVLKKNMTNGNAGSNSLGPGNLVFMGTAGQTITGMNVIQNMTVNNAAGVLIGGYTRVNGILTLTSGLVTLNANSLHLGPAATVSGAPSASAMVATTGIGELRKQFASAGSFTYPVGDATGVAEYSPVTLTFNSGTFASANYAGVNVVNAKYPGTGSSYLTRYWGVTQSGITNFSCNSIYQYVQADVIGNENSIYCFRTAPAPYTVYNAANTVSNTIDAHGLDSFGTFTGNRGDAPVPPAIRSLQDKTVSGGPDCADASQTMLIAGNGTYYHVTNTGYVNHIAGTRIVYYPGTKVDPGGYMHGYISTVFCNPYIHPVAQAPAITGIESRGAGNQDNSFFKIYPNPTPGKFTLELKGDLSSAQVHVEIFGVLGNRILSKDMQMERKQEFSLSEKPTGVYVVHVTSGEDSATEKIIKR